MPLVEIFQTQLHQTNINAVAGNATNINTDISSNVTTVAGVSSINTANSNATNINTDLSNN